MPPRPAAGRDQGGGRRTDENLFPFPSCGELLFKPLTAPTACLTDDAERAPVLQPPQLAPAVHVLYLLTSKKGRQNEMYLIYCLIRCYEASGGKPFQRRAV